MKAMSVCDNKNGEGEEGKKAEKGEKVQLDLAFCCDCTGSMGLYIRSAQENIRLIATSIHDRLGKTASVRFALVKYRDHPSQDTTFVMELSDFTENLDVMKSNVDAMAAKGGGDGPEAVAAALHKLNELSWRPNATKVCVLISDAPPHGLGLEERKPAWFQRPFALLQWTSSPLDTNCVVSKFPKLNLFISLHLLSIL
jgi:hypothetical protein